MGPMTDRVASHGAGVGALYVHVPFCVRKCAYCDFASEATRRDDPCMGEYVSDVRSQIAQAADLGLLENCVTAYVGGGTPSMLGASLLGGLVRAIREACPRVAELTCEANPDSMTDDVLAELVAAGATRVSIGVQSLDDRELVALGRIHKADQARERLAAAVGTGLDVSADLMCAIPHQTMRSWDETLRQTVDLGVGHVSVYPLAIEEGTPLYDRYGEDDVPWNSEDVQADRMERAHKVLEDAGLARYEVASYARDGKDCKHNQAYWTGVEYLGVGHGAASMLGAKTYDVVRRLYHWLPTRPQGPASAARMRFSTLDQEVEFLNRRQAWAEDLMLGMRMTRGVELSRFSCAKPTVESLVARGLVEVIDGRVRPTHDGWLLGNELYGALWELAEE